MKKIKAIGIMMILIFSLLLSVTMIVSADGPNYIYFADELGDSSIDVTVGNTFRFDIWTDVNQRIETINVKNVSYLPAGIVNYVAAGSTVRGTIFWQGYNDGYEVMFKKPGAAEIHDSAGWTGGATNHWLWSVQSSSPDYSVNNTDEQTWNVTWTAASCGIATFTVQPYLGSWGGTAYKGGAVGTSYITGTVLVHPMAISGFTATASDFDTIALAWTKNTGDDYTMVRYSNVGYPTTITDGSQAYNGTSNSYNHDVTPGLTYYYSAWGYNASANLWSLSYVSDYETTNAPPFFGVESPLNNSEVDISFTFQIPINDPEGDLINWTIECSNGQSDSANNEGNGTKSLAISGLDYSTSYIVWVNATDGNSWSKVWYNYTARDQYAPTAPTGFTASAISRFLIDLTWTPTDDYTYVEYSASPGPWVIGAGAECYNGTGSYYQYIAATPGETCYFQAWSYNVTDNVYSALFASASNTTLDDQDPVINNENPLDDSGNIDKMLSQVSCYIADPEGDLLSWTIEVSNGDSDSDTSVVNGTITCALTTPLAYSTNIIWWVNVTTAWGGTSEVYNFTVRDQYAPTIPTNLIASAISRTEIDLAWTPTDDYTYIEWSASSGPWVFGAGTPIYNNTGSSYPHTGLNDGTPYYYQAWSYNVTDNVYSTLFASDDNTTLSNTVPGPFSFEIPTNESIYLSVYGQYLKINCSDADLDSMQITFYWDNDVSIAFDTIASGEQASIYLPDYISPDWLPHQDADAQIGWYAIADDGFDTLKSDIYWFTTSYAWDCNEDTYVDYLDVSALSGVYGGSMTAGSIGPDINEDATVDYLDISSLAGHYGENY